MEGCSVCAFAKLCKAWIASERAWCSETRVSHSECTITKGARELIELSRISSMMLGKDIHATYRRANSRTKQGLSHELMTIDVMRRLTYAPAVDDGFVEAA